MKIKIIIAPLIISLALVSYAFIDVWLPYYNQYINGHKYQQLAKNQHFIVAVEPANENAPLFLQRIIIKAFPEVQVVFDNTAPTPNLIIRSQTIIREQRESSPYKNLDIPYITISGEPGGMPVRKYRSKGLPFADIVVYSPKKTSEIFVPFFLWSGVALNHNRNYNNYNNRKFLVYVSENCVAERENFFKLAQATGAGADALGSCSNTVDGKLIPGGYADLNDTYSQYNFVMAMENTQKPGYVSEKIINAFNSGAIPIYWGDSATVKTIFNPNAFIDLNNFANFEQAVAYIYELQNNPSKLAQMRSEPILNDSQNILWSINEVNSAYIAEQATKFRALFEAEIS